MRLKVYLQIDPGDFDYSVAPPPAAPKYIRLTNIQLDIILCVGGGGDGCLLGPYFDYLFIPAFRTSAEVRSRFLHSSRSVEGSPLGYLARIRTRACLTAGRRIYARHFLTPYNSHCSFCRLDFVREPTPMPALILDFVREPTPIPARTLDLLREPTVHQCLHVGWI